MSLAEKEAALYASQMRAAQDERANGSAAAPYESRAKACACTDRARRSGSIRKACAACQWDWGMGQ